MSFEHASAFCTVSKADKQVEFNEYLSENYGSALMRLATARIAIATQLAVVPRLATARIAIATQLAVAQWLATARIAIATQLAVAPQLTVSIVVEVPEFSSNSDSILHR